MIIFKRFHFLSGLLISFFVLAHLANHIGSLWGSERHLHIMKLLRVVYRFPLVEFLLISVFMIQIISGASLLKGKRKWHPTTFEGIQSLSGVYLLFFLLIHISAVFIGRYLLELDTNFYFGMAGLNSFPVNLFFIPYYGLAVIAYFGHLSSIHFKKMKFKILGISPLVQARIILGLGILVSILIIYGLTNRFEGFEIPKEYKILTGDFI